MRRDEMTRQDTSVMLLLQAFPRCTPYQPAAPRISKIFSSAQSGLQGYKAVTLGRRNVMVGHNHTTCWEDADDDTGTLLPTAKFRTSLRHEASSQTAWSCRSARRDCAWVLSRLFPRSGVGRGGDLSASPQCVVRATKLADAD